jgi:hypothetical protein
LSHREGGFDIALEEELFDCGSIGFIFLEQVVELIEQHFEAGGWSGIFRGGDNAKGNSDQVPVRHEAHESVASGGGTGVNSEGEGHLNNVGAASRREAAPTINITQLRGQRGLRLKL